MNGPGDILLVSGSPRRREILQMMGLRFEVFNADIDESRLADENPEDYVNRLARAKALAGLQSDATERPALGADTIVLIDGTILGKPADRVEAAHMLRSLSGQTHQVLSAVAVAVSRQDAFQVLNRTSVAFGEIPEEWIQAYVETAEPMDKAGAYAIQGRAAQWVSHIDGSFSGVMGLPLFETAGLLRRAGIALDP